LRTKFLSIVFCVLFAGSLMFECDTWAKSSSSSGSRSSSSSSSSRSSGSSSGSYGNSASKSGSSSSSSSSPSSSGYGNSASGSSPSTSSPASPSSGGGYGNSAGKSSSSGSTSDSTASKGGYGNSASSSSGSTSGAIQKSSAPKSPIQQKMDRSFSKQESAKAYEAYTAQQSKFQKGSGGSYNPGGREQSTINSVRNQTSYSSGSDYYSRRTVFYDTYSWQPPIYTYHSYSSFGIWDAMMLWFMLDHINDRQYSEMYYHHRDDPGMQQFRKELDRMSAENAELKEKVKQLDESTKSLEQQGVKVDPSYVPPDAASIALADSFAPKPAPKKESGFPWGWIAVIGALGIAGFLFMRRKR